MHTQGEWKATKRPTNYDIIVETEIHSEVDCGTIAEVYSCFTGIAKDNAERIVLCVNACDGINPKAVKPMFEALNIIYDKIVDNEAIDYTEIETGGIKPIIERVLSLAKEGE